MIGFPFNCARLGALAAWSTLGCVTVSCAGQGQDGSGNAASLEARSEVPAADAGTSDPLSDFKVRTTIQIPNDPAINPSGKLQTVDIGYWDQNRRLFFFSDRSNGGVE